MGILQLKQLTRQGSFSATESTFNTSFLAICKEPDLTEWQIKTDPKCPKPWTTATALGYGGAYIVSVNVTQNPRAKKRWTIDTSLSTNTDSIVDPNPLKREADITYDSSPRDLPCIVDIEGNPAVNYAGDFFEDLVTESTNIVIKSQKNIPPGAPIWLLQCCTAVNSQSISIEGVSYAKETLKVSSVSIGSKQVENATRFRSAQLQLEYQEDGWDAPVANKGLYEIAMERIWEKGRQIWREVKKPIFDHNGKPITSPHWLNKKGAALRTDMSKPLSPLKTKLTKSDIIIIRIKNRKRVDFSQLPLR